MSDNGLVDSTVPTNESIRAGVGRPGPIHEDVYNMIEELARSIVEEYLPQMGNVIGREGGQVIVTLDDEADDRSIGIPKRKGVRYQIGDRVKVSTTKGGDKHIDGIVSTTGKDGRDPAVDSDQVFAGGIKRINLDSRSVGSAELDSGAVGIDHLGSTSRNYIDGAYGAASAANTAAGVAQTTANQAIGKIGDDNSGLTKKANDAKDDAGRAQTRADNAWDKADNAQGRVATLEKNAGPSQSDFDTLKSKVTELERKVKKLGGGGSTT